MDHHAYVFHRAYRIIAAQLENFSSNTVCKVVDPGSEETNRVLDEGLFPIIKKSSRIVLSGYSPKWTDEFAGRVHKLPPWSAAFDSAVRKVGSSYILNSSDALASDLRGFWIRAGTVVAGTTIRPAFPLIEVDVESIPVNAIVNVTIEFGFIDRFFAGAGKIAAAKRWFTRQPAAVKAGQVYFAYQDPMWLKATGVATTLERYVDRIMIEGGWKDHYKTCNLMHDEGVAKQLLTPRRGESLDACAERVAREFLSA